MMLRIALYDNERDNIPKISEVSWIEWAKTLTTATATACTSLDCAGKKCPHKSSLAWSPVDIVDKRANENVKAVTALGLDGDGLSPVQLETVAARVSGLAHAAHTTHRNRTNEGVTFIRLIICLSRPVLASEWSTFYPKAISHLGLNDIFDATCKDLARLYYLPTHPRDVEFLSHVEEGVPLDVDVVLGTPIFEVEEDASAEVFTGLDKILSMLSAYRQSRAHRADLREREKADLLGRLLDGKPLAAPGGNAQPSPITPPVGLPKGRGYHIMRVAGILTGYLPVDVPDSVYLEIFRASIAAMCFGRNEDRKEMEEHLLEKITIGRDQRKEFDAKAQAKNAATRALLEKASISKSNGVVNGTNGVVHVAAAAATPPADSSNDDFDKHPVEIISDEAKMTQQVIDAINARGKVYQRGGLIVEVQQIPASKTNIERRSETWQIKEAKAGRVRLLAAKSCLFYSMRIKDGNEDPVEKHPPEWLPGSVLSEDRWPFPPLAGLAETPTLRPDGTIITEQGYDAATGIYLTTAMKISVPANPTLEDAKQALEILLDPLCDYPFASDASKSVFIAGMMSITARPMINGPVPMTIIEATMAGSGKSKLVDVASLITVGRTAVRMTNTDSDEEMDKRIVSLAIAGDQFVLIDNVQGQLGCPPLDAALTSTSYRGRVLGRSEMTPHLPMLIGWWATGNGMTIGADLARRALLCRIEPQCEHPEERADWKYDPLLEHVATHRVKLLSALLTILRAYVVAERPKQKLKPMGSYESWSDIVRSAIVWVGLPDPCDTIKDVRAADARDAALRAVVDNWPVRDGVKITPAELLEWAVVSFMDASRDSAANKATFDKELPTRKKWRAALIEWCPGRGQDLPTSRELGLVLRSIRGAIIGRFKIERDSQHTELGYPWIRICLDKPDLRLVPPDLSDEK